MTDAALKAFSDMDITFGASLSDLTTIRIGGAASAVVSVKNEKQVQACIALCKNEGIPFFILGGGSNILADDRGYQGVIIRFGRAMGQLTRKGESVFAESGARLYGVYDCCRYYDLGGAEFMSGIPATVGGAVYNNAGCYEMQMSDIVQRVYAVNGKERRAFEKEELGFGYRQSIFQKSREWVITGVEFKLKKGFDAALAQDIYTRKKLSQPLKSLSLGSIFKKSGSISPSEIIDSLGLKGLSVGGAQVSRVHAGFIVNASHRATSDDVKALIEIITEEVLRYYGLHLEREVEYLEYRSGCIV